MLQDEINKLLDFVIIVAPQINSRNIAERQ